MKDAIRYKITVTATVERAETAGREWAIIGQEPDGQGGQKDVRGYTPEITKTMRREIEVFEQTVENLDLAAVVAVVNGLQVPPRAES